MGFLDEASNLLNRGVANAGRGTRSFAIKAQLNDLKKQREDLCRQLGAALFEETRRMASLREPREALYAAMEALDAQSATLQGELAAIEQQARLSQAAGSRRCLSCGSPLGPGDMFCAECGAKAETAASFASAPSAAPVCRACGASLKGDMRFCMSCGAPVQAPVSAPAAPEPAIAEAPDAPAAAEPDMPCDDGQAPDALDDRAPSAPDSLENSALAEPDASGDRAPEEDRDDRAPEAPPSETCEQPQAAQPNSSAQGMPGIPAGSAQPPVAMPEAVERGTAENPAGRTADLPVVNGGFPASGESPVSAFACPPASATMPLPASSPAPAYEAMFAPMPIASVRLCAGTAVTRTCPTPCSAATAATGCRRGPLRSAAQVQGRRRSRRPRRGA